MKAFTTQNGRLSAGLTTIADDKLGRVVFLGEDGRGRAYEKIKIDSRRPPTVTAEGKVEEADVDSFDAGGRKRYALVYPHGPDHRILVRAHCGATYTKNTYGEAKGYWGSPQKLIAGYGAFGDAGRIGTWDDGLWTMSPGDALWVSPSGGHKVSPYLLWYPKAGDVPVIWKPEEWRTEVLAGLLAVATVEEVEAVLAATEKAGHKILAGFVRGKLAERAATSGATTTIRRNVRWVEEREAAMADLVTVFRGAEVKIEQVLADATNQDEARSAAIWLAECVTELKAARAAIVAMGETYARADNAVRVPSSRDVIEAQAEFLLGCVTAEEARKRDLSSLTIERWIPRAEQSRIRSARPATIPFGGKEYVVQYSWGGRNAMVEVPFGDLPPHAWLGLTGDLKLADGLAVRVKVKGEAWEVEVQGNLAQLPSKIQAASAQAQLQLWNPPSAYTLDELEFGDTPRNIEVVYGRNPLTGEALMARVRWAVSLHGSVQASWGSADAVPVPEALSPVYLTRVREYIKEKRAEQAAALVRATAEKEVEQVRKDLQDLQRQPGWDDLSHDERSQIRYRPSPGYDVAEKMAWVAESKALIAKFEGIMQVNLRERAEAKRVEREQAEAKAQAEAAHHEQMAAASGVSAIMPHLKTSPTVYTAEMVRDCVEWFVARHGKRSIVQALQAVQAEARIGWKQAAFCRSLGIDWETERYSSQVRPGAIKSFFAQPNVREWMEWCEGALAFLQNDNLLERSDSALTFTEKGGRHFQCGCEYMARVEKSTYAAYQAGQAITIVCNGCRKSGKVQKA